MANALLVGAGGFIGAILRYLVLVSVQRLLPLAHFPYGTLGINVLGCLLIGGIAGLADTRQFLSPEQRFFLVVGVLGSFTTFSTLGFESFSLAREGDTLASAANLGSHLILGMAAVWSGYHLGLRL